jgi:hypothetical protein
VGKERHNQAQHFSVVTLKYFKNECAHMVTMSSMIQLLISMMEKSSPYCLNLWPCKKQVHFMTGAHFCVPLPLAPSLYIQLSCIILCNLHLSQSLLTFTFWVVSGSFPCYPQSLYFDYMLGDTQHFPFTICCWIILC